MLTRVLSLRQDLESKGKEECNDVASTAGQIIVTLMLTVEWLHPISSFPIPFPFRDGLDQQEAED